MCIGQGTMYIVENQKEPEAFYFKERIYYADFMKDTYLCTKDGEKSRSEEEAFLYVDLGVLGGWWADPFHNLQQGKKVSNEYIPDGLVNELKNIHISMLELLLHS